MKRKKNVAKYGRKRYAKHSKYRKRRRKKKAQKQKLH